MIRGSYQKNRARKRARNKQPSERAHTIGFKRGMLYTVFHLKFENL